MTRLYEAVFTLVEWLYRRMATDIQYRDGYSDGAEDRQRGMPPVREVDGDTPYAEGYRDGYLRTHTAWGMLGEAHARWCWEPMFDGSDYADGESCEAYINGYYAQCQRQGGRCDRPRGTEGKTDESTEQS